MTNQDIIDFLIENIKDKEVTYTDSFIDLTKDKTICVYQRSGIAPNKYKSSKILGLTIVIVYTKNGSKAQEFVNDLFYNTLYLQPKQHVNDKDFFIMIDKLPVFLGRTDSQCYEYAIDLNIIY